ncbi:MAG: sodium:proton antiporter [Kiritimatiellae bacterium]|nr:sodium:proton antiporter [Kiritimatiellia bacterium]
MPEAYITDIAIALSLGLLAQWIGWRAHIPAILLLLLFGILAGPGLGWIDPDAMMGKLMVPVVSISVALILFEGGMSLRFRELKSVGKTVRNLVTVGAMVTWILATLLAWLLLDFTFGLASLLGAVLVVTGPTVIGPLVQHVRPRGQVGPTLRWEGIYIDPIGALLAVLVFEVLLAGSFQHASVIVINGILRTILVGLVVGGVAAALLVILLRKNWIPEYLDNPTSLILVIAVYAASNALQHESGLFTVTLMGTILANQSFVSVRHITRFKEDLRILLISFLFIILASRLKLADLQVLTFGSWVFVLLLVAVVRPASVWVSTRKAKISKNERLYLSFIAPRGIIAAAVSSVFALKLADVGYPGAERLVPITFFVIIFTVFLYGSIASPLARRLGLSQPNPQGFLLLGAHPWGRSLASALLSENIPVLLVDTNRANVNAARMDGLPAYHGNILMPEVRDELDLGGIGKVMALTPNDGANSLMMVECRDLFERPNMFQLMPGSRTGSKDTKKDMPSHLHGNYLFGKEMTFKALDNLVAQGFVIKKTKFNKAFTYKEFLEQYSEAARPLIVITENKVTQVVTNETAELSPKAGSTLISLIPGSLSRKRHLPEDNA